MTIFMYALVRNLRSPVAYFLGLIVPTVLIVAPANMWRSTPAAALVMLVTLMLLSANMMAALILEDRMDGSIIKVLISPVTMVCYIFQNMLASIIPFVLQIVLLGILGLLRYNWTTGFTVGMAVVLLVCAMSSAAFAFCWNMFFKSRSNSNYTFLFFMVVMMLISGLMIPVEALPGFMQHMGAVFYAYWFVRAVAVLADYGMTVPFWLYNAIVLFFGAGFLLLGGTRRTM